MHACIAKFESNKPAEEKIEKPKNKKLSSYFAKTTQAIGTLVLQFRRFASKIEETDVFYSEPNSLVIFNILYSLSGIGGMNHSF